MSVTPSTTRMALVVILVVLLWAPWVTTWQAVLLWVAIILINVETIGDLVTRLNR